jgi:hypothetical protein
MKDNHTVRKKKKSGFGLVAPGKCASALLNGESSARRKGAQWGVCMPNENQEAVRLVDPEQRATKC